MHFQARGHSFSPYGQTLSRQITCLFFFPLQPVTNGLVYTTLSLNRMVRRLLTICKKSSQRTSNSDTRQGKMFSIYFKLVAFPILCFPVRNFVRSLKFYYKTMGVLKTKTPKTPKLKNKDPHIFGGSKITTSPSSMRLKVERWRQEF